MDTVSMLNKMSFYCQPILPLVYDESMSYYETLCKVVGQLNTAGDAVNKLNEGLTGEIADRQAADASLDARIKQIEETNRKIHFLKIDTLGNLLTPDVTRENLSQWIQNGDLIAMLYAPDELENSWAVATNYRCLGATGADSMQLSFYVPISVTNNAGKSGEDVAQEVVVISLPVGALTNQWKVRHITTTIPETNADGFVNLTATVSNAWAVTCDVEPGAIIDALRNHFSSTNQFAVAVNARLSYDGKQYHSASAIVKSDASGSGNIRIEFENYFNGVRAENGVSQMNTETIFLVGDVSTNAWSVETIDHKAFDFSRYEGFQFTRGAHNVITANDESTPNAVYAQYHSDTSGKLYQNLPVRLIDTVHNAEYWNGVFDIKDNKHMTFTFVTSNYISASGKMAVRVIELSADVDTTTWKYAEKEFTLPLTGGGSDTVYFDFWPTGSAEEYDKDIKGYVIDLATDQTFDSIFDSIKAGNTVVARLYDSADKSDYLVHSVDATVSGDKELGTIHFQFVSAGSGAVAGFAFIGETITMIKSGTNTTIFLAANKTVLPTPNSDGTDNGKVPTVNGNKWELKTPDAGNSVPKPLTYDYMPAGYPKKTIGAVTVMEEQALAFSLEDGESTVYTAHLNAAPEIIDGQTYIVNWDGTDYECVCSVYLSTILAFGNKSIYGAGDDTGEPFLYISTGTFATLSTSASHTISIKTTSETATPMAEEFLPVASENNYGVVKKSEIVTSYKFDTFAPHDLMVKAITEFREGRASIVWRGALVVAAEHEPSTDKIALCFAIKPYEVVTMENLDGYYMRTTGVASYTEPVTNSVRLLDMNTNNKNAYCLLKAEGTQSDMAFEITANRLRLNGFEKLTQKELYLESSTTGSTKKFKITVDDSGTISATEVT